LHGKEKEYTIPRVSAKQDVLKILKAYTLKNRNPDIYFDNFLQFLERYLEKFGTDFPDLSEFRGAALREKLGGTLQALQDEGICSLQTLQDRIQLIRYVAYDIELVEQAYRRIQARGETPYPSVESLEIGPPPESLVAVDVKIDFINFLDRKPEPPLLLVLNFPSLAKKIVVTSRFIERPLMDTAVQKIRNYLRQSKNASYLQQKILPVFRQKERLLRDQLVNVVMKPDLTLQELISPSDFVFQFWTQVSNSLLKEYVPKKDKLEEEMDLCVAAYLLGMYAMHYKGRAQKERESEQALRTLRQTLDKAPYAFTLQDLHNLKDDRGGVLVRRIDRKSFSDFIEKETRSPDAVTLPELLRVRTAGNREYFIRRSVVAKILLERTGGLSEEFRNHYLDLWTDSLMNNRKLPEMLDDGRFSREVGNRLKERDPLFFSLLNFNLLFLLHEQVPLPGPEKDYLAGLFDLKARALIGCDGVLNLSRRDLYADARLRLPIWKVIPVLNVLVGVLRKMFLPSPKKHGAGKAAAAKTPASSQGDGAIAAETGRKAEAVKFREEVRALKARYIGEDGDIRARLRALEERWNPLLDPQAQANLTEDVNALIRDYIRKLKLAVHLRAPDPARLDKLAKDLANNEALGKIKDKENLGSYIALYMIDYLGKI